MEGREEKAANPMLTNAVEESSAALGSSPVDAQLVRRKVERQNEDPRCRPSLLAEPMRPPSDSPGLQKRLDLLQKGSDPTDHSSPVGTALLKKKAARWGNDKPPDQDNGAMQAGASSGPTTNLANDDDGGMMPPRLNR